MLAWTGIVYASLLTGNFTGINPLLMFGVMSVSWFVGLYAITKVTKSTDRDSDIA
jgi:hypothetical protein